MFKSKNVEFKKIITTELVLKVIFILWVAGTTIYFFYDKWQDFKISGIDSAYQAGRVDTVNQLLAQAEKSQCQPFSVFSGDKTIQLIDAKCIQAAGQGTPSQPTQDNK